MKPLLSPEGQAALIAAMQRQPLLAFDFDGTLAPIVARPQDARVPAPVLQRLQRLAAQVPVAIISGRAAADVRARLPFSPWRVVGNHGAEDDGAPRLLPTVAALEPARELLDGARDELARLGVTVEDKGASLAVHYRLARDREAAAEVIARLLQRLPPQLHSFGGKLVANVVVRGAGDKAEALVRLVRDSGRRGAIFVGDDVNDEPVFARREPGWFTVRVGRDMPDSQAQYAIDGIGDLPGMLDGLLAALPPAH